MFNIFRRDMKSELCGHKTVKIHGHKFVIKKLNPIMDFQLNDMPQIFTSFVSRRKVEQIQDPIAMQKDMFKIVEAGLVDPELVPVGKGDKHGVEAGITVEDIFRDPEIGAKLYSEIVFHSLNNFKGLKKVFFYLQNRARYYIALGKLMESYRTK